MEGGTPVFDGHRIGVDNPPKGDLGAKKTEIGIRPEFVRFAEDGIPVEIAKVSDAGRYRIVDARTGSQRINLLIGENVSVPATGARVAFERKQTRLYADGWLVE
jgi:glycerol transport system ATP-binding protein